MALDIASPDLLLDYDEEAELVVLDAPLVLDVASPDLLLALDDEDLILVCPY